MKGSDEAQVGQVTKIGAYLRQEREQQSISLESIALKTYIPLRLLTALEQGQSDKLPQAIFVQGFIRRYADAIGLDGMALSKTFVVEPSIVPLAATPQPVRPMPPLPAPTDNPGSGAQPVRASGAAALSPQSSVASQPIPSPSSIPLNLSPNFTESDAAETPDLAPALQVSDSSEAPPPAVGQPTDVWADRSVALQDAPEESHPEPIVAVSPPEPAIAHPPALELDPLELSSEGLLSQDVLPEAREAQAVASLAPEPVSSLPEAAVPEPEPFNSPSPASSPVPLPALKTSIYGTQTPQKKNSYLPFAILAAGAAVFLVAIASFFVNKPKPAAQAPATPSTSPALSAPGATPSPAPSPTATPKAMPVQVSMNLTEEAWVQITADDKVVFEGVQPKNFQKVWSAQKSLKIVSGNAGAVLLSSNQSPPKPMGQSGEVQELSFPAPVP